MDNENKLTASDFRRRLESLKQSVQLLMDAGCAEERAAIADGIERNVDNLIAMADALLPDERR